MLFGRRRLLALGFVLALSLTASCKKPGGSAPGGSASSRAGAPEVKEIVIGHFASMTGDTAHFGQDTDRAIRLAVDEANAAGGVLKKQVRVVTFDDRGDSAEASNAVSRLIDVEKVTALLGEVQSSLSLAAGRVAQRRKVVMISPSSTNPRVTEVGDYVFRVCFIDPFQGKVMATFARNTLKMDKVAILKDVKSDYSIGLADAFKTAFTALGGSIVVEQSYSKGDTDFSAQVTAIKSSKAQALYVPGYYAEVGAIARTKDRLGVKIPMMGGDGWDAPDLYKIGGAAIDGSYFSNHFDPGVATSKAQRFIADFKKKYGVEPTGLGALGYDAAAVLFAAIERAQSLDSDAIRVAVSQTKNFEGVTGKITLNPHRDAEKSAVVLKIEKGKAKYETTVEP